MARQDAPERDREWDTAGRRRNPYLAGGQRQRSPIHNRTIQRKTTQTTDRYRGLNPRASEQHYTNRVRSVCSYDGDAGRTFIRSVDKATGQHRPISDASHNKIGNIRQQQPAGRLMQPTQRPVSRQQATSQRARRLEQQRRRRIRQMQRMAVLCGFFCILALSGLFLLRQLRSPQVDASVPPASNTDVGQMTNTALVQGIPAEDYAKHPEWEEDFLTPNEYSRPGDPLTEVKNVFVHYTANPGTSAAQNRSYFEQQKDVHERSVSAHFIIGYEGEILQCVPLDEIAYAVQTRNEDSISIECCYLASDGSFTQETYDSLIELLRWLIDTYDLESQDILRHYDCGGKKCPLYYTEHEDAWERLKQDVDDL